MLGYVEMKEALVWIQLTGPSDVQLVYRDSAAPTVKIFSEKVQTTKADAFTAKLLADQVEPGHTYYYDLKIDGKITPLPGGPHRFRTQPLWQYRTDPPPFSVVAGSCTYVNEEIYDRPGKGYGSEFGIFNSILAQKPDLMLWLGDNVYFREADWFTTTGMIHRWTHARSLPELQPLLAACPHLGIWDDHDFGPNDSDRTWVKKAESRRIQNLFWGNPSAGLDDGQGITTFYRFADMDFFLLDGRWSRAPNDCKTCERTILGARQRQWLCEALAASRAPFKLVAVGGQFLSESARDENFSEVAKAERDSILAFIDREKISGVVFLTGDKHFAEFSRWTGKNGTIVHDLTTSSLTAGSNSNPRDVNPLRVDGTLFTAHNFAQLNFSGKRTARKLEIRLFDTLGKEVWMQEINAGK